MQKAYNPTIFENTPSVNTPLNETNLNKISRGLSEVDDRVIALDLTKLPITEASGMITGITINQDNGDITVIYYSGATSVLHTLLAQVAINFDYDPKTERLIIYLQDGTKKYIDLSALITQFEFLDSDVIYWTIGDDGKVKAGIKKGSITAELLQPDYLADITVQAEQANASATAAAKSAIAAAASEAETAQSEENARVSAEQANKSATSANASATAAKKSETAADGYAKTATDKSEDASQSAAAAADSADMAGRQAQTATDKAGKAANSATTAANSAAAASASAKQAKIDADRAETYASITEPKFYLDETTMQLYMKDGAGVDFVAYDNVLYWKVA